MKGRPHVEYTSALPFRHAVMSALARTAASIFRHAGVRKPLALLVVALALAAGVAVALTAQMSGTQRAYSVAQVNAGLTYNPSAWLGRVVTVRGRLVIPISLDRGAVICCSGVLVDPALPGQRIRLVWRAVGPLLAALLRVPVVKSLVAGRVGAVGVYRVRLMRLTRMVPAQSLPNYYPYVSKTVAKNEDRAELVGALN